MKIDRGLLGTLAVAALGAACASAGGTGAGGGGPRVSVPVPTVACSTGPLATSPSADSAAANLTLIATVADSAQRVQYTLARAQAGRAIAAGQASAYGYYLAGQAAIGLADYADADSLFRRSVELCPELGEYDVNRLRRGTASLSLERGGALIQSGDTTAAAAAYQTALNLDPNSYPAEFYLGLVSFNRQNTEEAVRRWRRVLQVIDALPADSSAEVMANRAETRGNTLNALVLASAQHLNRQQSAEAAALLADLTRWLPNSPDAWYNYALALNNLQRYTDLVPVAQRATEISPLSYGAWVLYYNAYAGQSQAATAAGNTAQAGELGRQARQISSRSEALPVQLESFNIDVEGENTLIRGVAVGAGPTAPVQVEFTLHGSSGELGRGTVTITPPARQEQTPFELTIPNSAPVLGVTYRVAGS
ncbi:tetratricopeptide repeat protein [Longimicrobium sp.]|uniref:tetratricopeptide repeat protein n=1 Tax=Longimicrobium sp. TaxID=2029185 RepID=UPI003B3AEEF3